MVKYNFIKKFRFANIFFIFRFKKKYNIIDQAIFINNFINFYKRYETKIFIRKRKQFFSIKIKVENIKKIEFKIEKALIAELDKLIIKYIRIYNSFYIIILINYKFF